MRSALELDLGSRPSRLVFAAIYAAVSCMTVPWAMAAGWLALVLAWEFGSFPIQKRLVMSVTNERALNIFAAFNVVGASIFSLVALMNLATATPIGVAIGATWLGGSFMSNFIYFGENRRLLWSCIAPAIVATVVGPLLAHGISLPAIVTSGLILTALAAARSFSVDHQTLLQRLADRQSALADTERKLSLAVEASGDGLFESDLIAGGSWVSEAWASMLGYTVEEVGQHRLIDLVHPDDVPRLMDDYQAHDRGLTTHAATEIRLRCKDGEYKWVLSRARMVERAADGRPSKLIGTTVDITARKALEHQLEAARDAAERGNAAKTTFVANMSHEIRTPLNGVIGVAGALARTRLSTDQREMVDLVRSSAQILERLLTDILDQSKLEAGEFELQSAPFDLRDAVEAAAELMRPRAEDKGLAFTVDYAPSADGQFEGDAVRLRQIISNLTANAIKFTEKGDVRIAVEVGAAGDYSDHKIGMVTVRVSDTGIGFDAGTAERLFGRFVQADGSIARRFGGSGLGLAISRALAHRMGGSIDAESTPGVGSVFTVRIPLRRAAAPATVAAVAEADEDEGFDLTGLRVLLAEDHPTNQRVVQLFLTPLGVDLTIVDDGAKAIDAVANQTFDLVLMDMQMPNVDGLTAIREIRRREAGAGAPRLPIAMLTANAMDEHRAQAAEVGADGLIPKPITPQSLIDGMISVLSATPAPAAAGELAAAG